MNNIRGLGNTKYEHVFFKCFIHFLVLFLFGILPSHSATREVFSFFLSSLSH